MIQMVEVNISSLQEFCASETYDIELVRSLPDYVKDMILRKIRTSIKENMSKEIQDRTRRLFTYLNQYKIDTNVFTRGTVTITFGEVAENHVGNQQIGSISNVGFLHEDLRSIQNLVECRYGAVTELINLNDAIDGNGTPASVLIVRNAADLFLGQDLFDEARSADTSDFKEPEVPRRSLTASGSEAEKIVYDELVDLEWDKKFYDTRRKKVLDKQARWNLIISEQNQEPDYEKGMGRIVPWSNVPRLRTIFDVLKNVAGDKARDLHAEGNYYYNPSKCGIGWHGDSERKKVIAFRFGHTIPLMYQWYDKGVPIGEKIILNINDGDMYIMSEKSTGFDWSFNRYKTLHLRHSAGSSKYTTIKEKKPKKPTVKVAKIKVKQPITKKKLLNKLKRIHW
jgi:hypothetical protein